MEFLSNQWPGLLATAFIAIVFLQSGFDKLFNYSSELGWIRQKFVQSPLYNYVGFLFLVLTSFEILSGFLAFAGVVQMLMGSGSGLAWWGALMATVTMLMLIFGQRITKDYTGAASLVPYFISCMLGLYFLS